MTKRKPIIAINTLAFHGYTLDMALKEIAQLADYVEPVFITKYDPTLDEEYFNEDNARMLTQRLEQLGLKLLSMGSHMDLGQADAAAIFKNRMEFAKAIGAGTIITNAGRKPDQEKFDKNMNELIAYAEKIELTIALENPGDGQDLLLADGIEGIEILEKLGSDRVRLNYDFSNVFTYSKGKRYPEERLTNLLPYIDHLHLKNVKLQNGQWRICGLEEGVIDYKSLFHQFPILMNVPMSIELPMGFRYDAQFNFGKGKMLTASSIEHVRRILSGSMDHLSSILA